MRHVGVCCRQCNTACVLLAPGNVLCFILVITYCVCPICCVSCLQGLDAELLSRLPEWRFACDFLLLRAGPEMPWGDNHTALLNALKHLCDAEWVRHDMLLKLVAWCWDPDMMRKYAQTIPALQERGLARHVVHMDEPLTDDMLSACIEVSARTCNGFSCECLGLRCAHDGQRPYTHHSLSPSTV